MLGNPSVRAIAICALALHAAHRGAAAADEASSDPVDDEYDHHGIMRNNNNIDESRQRRKHIRRRGKERDRRDDGDDGDGRESATADVEERSQYGDRPSSSIVTDRRQRTMEPGGADDAIDGCANRKWHPDFFHGLDDDALACTNGLDYPPSWNLDSDDPAATALRDIVVFDSPEACCDALVETLSSGSDGSSGHDHDGTTTTCFAIDDCGGTPTVAASTEITVLSESSRRRELSCSKMGWHPNTQNDQGCSNDDRYPKSWESHPSLKDRMFYSTAGDCCKYFFKINDCPVLDACGGGGPASPPTTASRPNNGNSRPGNAPTRPVPSPTGSSSSGASSCKWHLALATQDGCTNDDDYPASWLNPNSANKMFFDTAQACCSRMFSGMPCAQHNRGCSGSSPGGAPSRPAPSPAGSSSSCKWHLDLATQDGCTNDDDYPSGWLDPNRVHLMFFDTAQACCIRMFSGMPCARRNRGCSGSSSGGAPSRPTRRPISRPTPPPTPLPTASPTPVPKVYWVKEATGVCVEDADDPKPHWIEATYPAYEECCPHARDPKACMASRPVDPLAPGSPTGRPTMKPFLFYVDPSTGLCVEDSEKKKPGWIDTTWPAYEFCCNMDEAVRDKELCMRARPTMINGISFGTLAPTRSPPPGFYADPGNGMCTSEVVKPKPSHVESSFDNYSRCCILASANPETCLASDPFKLKETSSPTTTTSAPTPTPPADYYLQQALAICVNLHDVPNPGWIETTFGEDYDACCKTSWDEAKCMAAKPSLPPTDFPTWAPSTPWPTETALCPNPYDPKSTVYARKSEVEVNLVAYRCKGHPVYCNKPEFQPPREDPGPSRDDTSGTQSSGVIIVANTNDNGDGDSLWKEAWERVSICVPSPTRAPSMVPTTASPTCKTRWHPGEINKRICTNSDKYPKMWDAPPLSDNYFVDTAEECCDKFYGGKRCRVRDVC